MIRPNQPSRAEIVYRELLLNGKNGTSEREIALKYDKFSMRNEVTEFERLNDIRLNRTSHRTKDGKGSYFRYSPKDSQQAKKLIEAVNLKAKARGDTGFSESEALQLLAQFN